MRTFSYSKFTVSFEIAVATASDKENTILYFYKKKYYDDDGFESIFTYVYVRRRRFENQEELVAATAGVSQIL